MSIFAFIKKATLKKIGDAIRTKHKEPSTKTYFPSEMAQRILDIQTGFDISDTTLETPNQMLMGVKAHKANGELVTGEIPTKTSADLTASGRTVSVPSGYYASDSSKSTSLGSVGAPAISVDESGLITATASKTAGYISDGNVTNTKPLTTKSGGQITPTSAGGTIVSAGTYVLGNITLPFEPDLDGAYILSDHNIYGVPGEISKQELPIPTLELDYDYNVHPPKPRIKAKSSLLNSGYVTKKTQLKYWDQPDLLPENIKNGKVICDVEGTLVAPAFEDLSEANVSIIRSGGYDSSFKITTSKNVKSIQSLSLAMCLNEVDARSELIVAGQYVPSRKEVLGVVRYANGVDEMGGDPSNYDVSFTGTSVTLSYNGRARFDFLDFYNVYGTIVYEEA